MLTLCSACGLFSKGTKVDPRPVVELGAQIAALPPKLDRDCDDPTPLAAGPLNAGAAERVMGHDRKALLECKQLHKNTRDFYKDRDSKLSLTANANSK